MLINTPNQVLKLPDQKKALLERINYINPKIKSCRFVKDLIILQINEKLKNKEIELIKKDLRKISNRIATDKAFSEERVIFINYVKQSSNTIKTYDKLLKEKDLKQISPGLFTLKGKLLKEFNNLNQVLLNYSKKSNFQDMYVHSMLPTKSLIDNGYLSNFAHHVFFSSNIETKISSIDKISNLDHDDLDEIKKKLDLPKMVMSPAVCYHCFETLKKTRINKNIVYNSISSCNRFENQNYKSLERLQSFTMREYVAFGDEKFINSFYSGFREYSVHEENCIKLYFKKLKEQIQNAQIYKGNIKDYSIVATFADYAINEVAHFIIQKHNADIGIIVNTTAKTVSFRRAKGGTVDVSILAKNLCNGSGNTRAAGGTLTDEFISLTKTFTP